MTDTNKGPETRDLNGPFRRFHRNTTRTSNSRQEAKTNKIRLPQSQLRQCVGTANRTFFYAFVALIFRARCALLPIDRGHASLAPCPSRCCDSLSRQNENNPSVLFNFFFVLRANRSSDCIDCEPTAQTPPARPSSRLIDTHCAEALTTATVRCIMGYRRVSHKPYLSITNRQPAMVNDLLCV